MSQLIGIPRKRSIKPWVTFDDAGWSHQFQMAIYLRVIAWRAPGFPTFVVAIIEGREENYTVEYHPDHMQLWGARAVISGDDFLSRAPVAIALVQGMNIELERQRVAAGISQDDFRLICASPTPVEVRPDGKIHRRSTTPALRDPTKDALN